MLDRDFGFRDASGVLRWRGPFDKLPDARAKRGEEIARRHRGEKVSADPKLTFDRAADLWFEARVKRLRPATQSAYTASPKHVRPVFGRRKLTGIESGDIASFVAKQPEFQKGWTVKGQLTVISAVFRYAGRHLGYASTNPVAMLDKRGVPEQRPRCG